MKALRYRRGGLRGPGPRSTLSSASGIPGEDCRRSWGQVRGRLLLIFLLLPGITTACEPSPSRSLDPVSVSLSYISDIELKTPDGFFVGDIRRNQVVDVSPEGLIAIADRLNSRVVLFDANGNYLRSTGRRGDGPGEFRGLWALGWVGESRDRLWVADSQDRVTVYDTALAIDTLFRIPGGADFVAGIQPVGSRVVFSPVRHPRIPHDVLAVYDLSGSEEASFLERDARAWEVPYLGGEYLPVFAVFGDSVLAGSSLGYPLQVLDLSGNHGRFFGDPPPALGEPEAPELGAFDVTVNPRARAGYEAWVRSFGIVHSVWVLNDSIALVEHRRLDQGVLDRRVPTFHLDVYSLSSGEKIAEDLEIPGFIVATHDGNVWLLTTEPPDPWQFSVVQLEVSW